MPGYACGGQRAAWHQFWESNSGHQVWQRAPFPTEANGVKGFLNENHKEAMPQQEEEQPGLIR